MSDYDGFVVGNDQIVSYVNVTAIDDVIDYDNVIDYNNMARIIKM